MKLITFIICCIFCSLGFAASSAEQPPSDPMGFVSRINRDATSAYSLKLKPIGKPKMGEQKSRLLLQRKATGATLWTVIVHQIDTADWSPYHKALAVADNLSMFYFKGGTWHRRPNHLRLITWRVGEKPVVLEHLPILKEMEFITELKWSPDKQRLIVLHASSQGSASIEVYRGWCLRIRDRSITKLGLVREAQWLGPRRVRYQSLRYIPDKGYMRRSLERTIL